MSPDTYASLLKDLQKLQKKLVKAYVDEARQDPSLKARIERRHAEAEVGGKADAFAKLCARRSAVQLLLRTVYVRVLEDLEALEPPRIRGDWGLAAFREVAPALGVRAHLAWTFRDLARDFPALFTPGPDELPLPSEDLCREIWDLWHRDDGKGHLVYDWRNGDGKGFESRFLGDLYQDLDKDVSKLYALKQTPEFVERYILEKTLDPALEEFDPEALRDADETFRLLDPTCGSGHFLIGSFHRLADYWEGKGLGAWAACERALEGVWGCDINPHAVDIARFRLLLEVRARTGVTDLDRLAALPLNLAVMDSLIPWERLNRQGELFPGHDRLARYGTAEEREANAAFLDRDFHVVVGNPPYITPKDKQKRDDYRAFWPDSAAGRYALSAPFVERVFTLGTAGAFNGQITANSFMKRTFGKKLVSEVIPRWDLAGVVDTSGAYIPGHGTPTVLLFARSQPPSGRNVWAVLGKRGEPKRPDVAEEGIVWTSIADAPTTPSDENPFVTVAHLHPETFHGHPWSLGGGAAGDLKASIESEAIKPLGAKARIGMMTILNLDDAYIPAPSYLSRNTANSVAALVLGQCVRDYVITHPEPILFPYGTDAREVLQWCRSDLPFQHFWKYRDLLLRRNTVGLKKVRESDMSYYEYSFHHPDAFVGLGITFAFVSTHNHFVLDRGGKVFNRTAPVIKLPDSATLEDHLDLLGLLNSSTLGFWMKQVFFNKGSASGEAIRSEDWEPFWEYDATKLQQAPLTSVDRDARVALARALDATATERAACLPAAVLDADWSPEDLVRRLAEARARYRELTHRMVALQEELDWLTYHAYGLLDATDAVGPDEVEPLAPAHRPFEILAARADEEADPDERSAWWSRHGHDKVTEIPAHYGTRLRARIQARTDAIESDDQLALLETFPFKRRWQTPDLDKETASAAESWLLDRLEDLFADGGPLAAPRPYRLEEIVAAWSRDPRVLAVAAVFAGTRDFDLTVIAERLLRDQAIPDNPFRVYTDEGLRKLEGWKEVWAVQDREDAGEDVGEIPVPEQFKRTDFQDAAFFKIRGKLNVPRERFVLFADLAPQRFGWNGWRDKDRAMAQVESYTVAETDPIDPLPPPTADDPRRCGSTVGLWEALPDVRRWADAGTHDELQALAQEVCGQTRCPCAVVERWQAWQRGEIVPGSAASSVEEEPVTVEERHQVTELIRQIDPQVALFAAVTGATVDGLSVHWRGPRARLERILDDLLASGDVAATGRGKRKTFTLTQGSRA